MKYQTIILVLAILAVLLMGALITLSTASYEGSTPVIVDEEPQLTHEQIVWIYALEWCESRGQVGAINEKDLDGTPSYYSYQFKPGTFRGYGELYGVIEEGYSNEEIMTMISSWDLQRQIVEHMVLDETVQWERQFPGCVKKIGRPPKE